LDVSGTITAANITANTGVFTGNGNGLSSLVGANVSGAVSYATTANAVAGANVSGTVANATFATSAGSADSVAGANVSGQVANALVAGTVYTNAQANITSVGTLTSLDVSGTITAANITANTGVFTGNGNGLSSLVGANVTGNVGNALNAYAVAGANVTGTVANATFATSAGSADSVAVANVSGIGNIATVNLDGNLSNILYGNGVFASAPAGGSYGNSNVATFLASYGSNTISTTGNITAGNIIGNGQALTGIAGANVSGQVANALVAGTVYTNAQPNITSVGTLTNVSVSGNVNSSIIVNGGTGIYLAAGPAGYINFFTTGGDKATISDTGNIAASNLIANSTVFAVAANISGNVNAGNVSATTFTGALSGAATTAGTVTTNAQPNITSVGTLTSLAVTGNATSGNFIGRLANGNSNVNIAAANGNVTIAAVGNTTLTITGTGANIAGYANVSGNVTAAYYSGNGSPLTGVVATVRTVTVADATSITMNADTSDVVVQTNTQAVGTLTINAVSGTPINGQKIILRLQSANVQTFAWNAVFAGSTDTPLPTVSSGSNKYDYMGFIYNSLATNWQMMAKNFGF
jgi:hypothetical protein